jgi:hypothetical protein
MTPTTRTTQIERVEPSGAPDFIRFFGVIRG